MNKLVLIKHVNNVRMFEEVEGRHFYIYVGDKFVGSDIFLKDAIEKFNKAVITGKVV